MNKILILTSSFSTFAIQHSDIPFSNSKILIVTSKNDLSRLNPKDYSTIIIDTYNSIGLTELDDDEVIDKLLWEFNHCQMWTFDSRSEDYIEFTIKGVTVTDSHWFDKEDAINSIMESLDDNSSERTEYTVEMLDAMAQKSTEYKALGDSFNMDILAAIHLGIIVLP